MSATLLAAWIVGFVIKTEPLPSGATRVTLDNGQIGIVENPQNLQSYERFLLLNLDRKQDGFTNDGVAFKKNRQNIVTEIRKARVRVGISSHWEQPSKSSLVYGFYKHYGNAEQRKRDYEEPYLSIVCLPTPTPYELTPLLSDFPSLSRIAEDASKNHKPVDIVFGNHPAEIIDIQFSQSAFKNLPGSLQAHYLSGDDEK
ncbi:MAG: hypothetical protein LBB65_01445 [Burkholderiales bacterium]|jgi:hypothetical protein|nr:hypothetical protein [Burkholderiales bacterium]